jgi:hypothetical protein
MNQVLFAKALSEIQECLQKHKVNTAVFATA